MFKSYRINNKANLRDLKAATGLVILLKLDSNHRFLAGVTLKFDGWPKTRQIWRIWKLRLAYSPETANLGQNRWCFVPCDLEIWWMTLNKANLRDLIAATGLVISNWIQIFNFSARVTVKFDGWPRKTIGHFFYTTWSFVQHFVAIGEFKLELQSGNAQSGSNSTFFIAVRPWNLTDDLAKQ